MKYNKNIELDAKMVHAASIGLFDCFAYQSFKTPDEAYGRAMWLKKQSESYIKEVSDRVVEIEKELK
jgi:hypothetical protein